MGFFLNFRPFLNAMTNTVQNLTIKRWYAWDSNPGGMMVGADESTELWRHPKLNTLLSKTSLQQFMMIEF